MKDELFESVKIWYPLKIQQTMPGTSAASYRLMWPNKDSQVPVQSLKLSNTKPEYQLGGRLLGNSK